MHNCDTIGVVDGLPCVSARRAVGSLTAIAAKGQCKTKPPASEVRSRSSSVLHRRVAASFNQRIEPMRGSAFRLVLYSVACRAPPHGSSSSLGGRTGMSDPLTKWLVIGTLVIAFAVAELLLGRVLDLGIRPVDRVCRRLARGVQITLAVLLVAIAAGAWVYDYTGQDSDDCETAQLSHYSGQRGFRFCCRLNAVGPAPLSAGVSGYRCNEKKHPLDVDCTRGWVACRWAPVRYDVRRYSLPRPHLGDGLPVR